MDGARWNLYNKEIDVSNEAPVIGIGILCSDPRANLWKETKQHLILPEERIVPLGFLGGPICLANPEDLPMERNFLLAQIYFALATFPDTRRFLVIGHDCGYYAQIKRRRFDISNKKNDLCTAADFLRKRFPEFTTTAFFKHKQKSGFEAMA